MLNEFSAETLFESLGMETGENVSVYDLDGNLVLLTKASELTADNYKTLFQSDLIMEESGNSYYIILYNKSANREIGSLFLSNN